MSMNNAKDLFKWLASDELTKEEILEMLTEEMCAELIVRHNMPYLERNDNNYDYHYDGEVVGTFKAPNLSAERFETLLYNAISCLEDYECDRAQLEADLGITEEEYDAVMGVDEQPSLNELIDRAASENISNFAPRTLPSVQEK